MARPALVLDASVGVKWFSDKGEGDLVQALAIRHAHEKGDILVLVPDLFLYEVTNALVQRKEIPVEDIQAVVQRLISLGLDAIETGADLMAVSAGLARRSNITVYDACYMALAIEHACPLVTANPRHQRPDLGCEVIPIGEWRGV